MCFDHVSHSYAFMQDVGHKYGPQNYPVPPAAIGYCCDYNLYADRVSEYCDQVVFCLQFQIPQTEQCFGR